MLTKENKKIWLISDNISVVNCALLACGQDPYNYHSILKINEVAYPKNFYSFLTAFKNAIFHSEINANTYILDCHDINHIDNIDLEKTTINRHELTRFLINKKINDAFFNPKEYSELPSYLDCNHPIYSKEIHATIELIDKINSYPDRLIDKRPTEIILELIDDIGKKFKLSDGAKKRVSRMANWKQSGNSRKYTTKDIEIIKKYNLDNYNKTDDKTKLSDALLHRKKIVEAEKIESKLNSSNIHSLF